MIRHTKQREAIFKALDDAQRPLSAMELHELARAHFSRLGLRTVYRNIRELVEAGQLVGVDYPGQPPRYERNTGGSPFPHFICRKCDKVHLLTGVEVEDISVQLPSGYQLEGQEVIFYGICPDCDSDE